MSPTPEDYQELKKEVSRLHRLMHTLMIRIGWKVADPEDEREVKARCLNCRRWHQLDGHETGICRGRKAPRRGKPTLPTETCALHRPFKLTYIRSTKQEGETQ